MSHFTGYGSNDYYGGPAAYGAGSAYSSGQHGQGMSHHGQESMNGHGACNCAETSELITAAAQQPGHALNRECHRLGISPHELPGYIMEETAMADEQGIPNRWTNVIRSLRGGQPDEVGHADGYSDGSGSVRSHHGGGSRASHGSHGYSGSLGTGSRQSGMTERQLQARAERRSEKELADLYVAMNGGFRTDE
ncbi:MAG: hypothetical protein Q9170_003081 [Blastenia crenularia]